MPLFLDISVVPASGRSQCILQKDGKTLKCFLKNPPERGKANDELIALFAKALKIPKNQVLIASGQISRKKRIKIESDMTREKCLMLLGIDQQLSLSN